MHCTCKGNEIPNEWMKHMFIHKYSVCFRHGFHVSSQYFTIIQHPSQHITNVILTTTTTTRPGSQFTPVPRSQKDFKSRGKQGLRQTSQWLTIHSTGSHLQTSPPIQRVVGRLWHSTERARVPTSRLLAGAKSLAGSKRDGVSWGGGTCQQPITWWDWPSAHPVYERRATAHTHAHVCTVYTQTHTGAWHSHLQLSTLSSTQYTAEKNNV